MFPSCIIYLPLHLIWGQNVPIAVSGTGDVTGIPIPALMEMLLPGLVFCQSCQR